MYKIVRKKELNSAVTLMEIEAPFIAKKAKAGQFIIFRIDEQGERVPLTIAGYDREKGTVTIIFQKVGFSTIALGNLNEGDYIRLIHLLFLFLWTYYIPFLSNNRQHLHADILI